MKVWDIVVCNAKGKKRTYKNRTPQQREMIKRNMPKNGQRLVSEVERDV